MEVVDSPGFWIFREPHYLHFGHRGQRVDGRTGRLLRCLARQGSAQAIEAYQALFAAPPQPVEELYDLTGGPDEVHNLALEPRRKETLAELRALVDEFARENDARVT